jgi:protein gp37
MGCTKVSPACDHCYAEALGKRTGRVQWGDDAPRVVTSDAYWRNPIKWNATAEAHGVRHRVFCASLADVFEARAELVEPRERLFDLIARTSSLDWLLLTKRPQHVIDMVPDEWLREGERDAGWWPSNVWIGTTVEDQARADERIPTLCRIPAAVRFLSIEPQLERIDLTPWMRPFDSDRFEPWLHWVIVGGESGPGHRPLNLDHARDVRDQCQQYGVPFFFKQVGGQFPHSGGDQLDGITYKAFPRQAVAR